MKRIADHDIDDRMTKCAKYEEEEENVATKVFGIYDLCNMIISYLYDPFDDVIYEDRTISMRMLALVSKSTNENCVLSARQNHHKKMGIDFAKRVAIKLGYESCLDYLHKCDPISTYVYDIKPSISFMRKCYFMGFYLCCQIYTSCIEKDDVECLEYAYKLNGRKFCESDVIQTAVSGSVKCLDFISRTFLDKSFIASTMVEEDQLECFDYCVKNFKLIYPLEREFLLRRAIECGSIKCVKYMLEENFERFTTHMHYHLVGMIHRNSSPELIRMLISNGYLVNDATVASAIETNDVEFVKEILAMKDFREYNIPEMFLSECKNRNWRMIKFIHEQFGLELKPMTIYIDSDIEGLKYIAETFGFSVICSHKLRVNMEMLQYLKKYGQMPHIMLCQAADLETFKELLKTVVGHNPYKPYRPLFGPSNPPEAYRRVSQGIRWIDAIRDYWKKGLDTFPQPECKKYEQGHPRYAIEVGAISELTWIRAIEMDDVDLLQYLHEKGPKIYNDQMEMAIRKDATACMLYLIKRGFKVHEDAMIMALEEKCMRSAVFLKSIGHEFGKDMQINRPHPVLDYIDYCERFEGYKCELKEMAARNQKSK